MKALSLKSGLNQIKSVYVLSGQDRFLVNFAKKRLKAVLVPQFPELNSLTLDYSGLTSNSLFETLQALPFADQFRLVIIENFKAKKGTDEILKMLETHSQKNDFSTVVVIEGEDSGSVKGAEVIDCSHLTEEELNDFIVSKVSKAGGKISRDAVRCLIEFSLRDLSKIDLEVDKLLSFKLNEEINLKDVESFVSKDKEYQVFEIANLIARGEKEKCVEAILTLTGTEKSAFWIISPLYNTYKRALFVAINKNLTDAELAKLLQVKEYAVKMLRVQTSVFSPRVLKKFMDSLFELECDIKNGKMKEDIGIIEAITDILLARK